MDWKKIVKIFFVAIIVSSNGSLRAQWMEEFESDLRYWKGDTAWFSCSEGTLRSRGPEEPSRLALSRAFLPSGKTEDRFFYQGVMKGDSAFCVEFALDLGFVPSSTNHLRLYLLCRDTALQDSSHAVYLHLGQKESANYWQLWKSGPDTAVMLWQGNTLFSKQKQMRMRVRAVFQPSFSRGKETNKAREAGKGRNGKGEKGFPEWDQASDTREKARWFLCYTHDTGSRAQWHPDGEALAADLPTMVREEDFTPFHTGLVCQYRTGSRASLYAFGHVSVARVPDDREDAGPEPADTIPQEPGRLALHDSLSRLVPAFGRAGINEVLFDPPAGGSRFVEFFNLADTVFGLERWALAIPDPDQVGFGLVREREEGEKALLEERLAALTSERRRMYEEVAAEAGIPLDMFFSHAAWKYYPLTRDTALRSVPSQYLAAAKDARMFAGQVSACRENVFTAQSFPALDAKQGLLRLVWLPYPGDSLSRDTVVVDEIFYTEKAHHWLLPDAEGVSLERLDPAVSGLEAANWMSAAETSGFSTPGCENSHALAASLSGGEEYFTFDPPLVTPDNDGAADFTRISWDARLDGFLCTMTVYDHSGRKMGQICQQVILGSGGSMRYDAVDGNGRVLRRGIYVVFVDLIRPDGKRKRLRYPFAVG